MKTFRIEVQTTVHSFQISYCSFPNFLASFQTPLSFFVCVELSIRVIGIHRANELDHRLEQCSPVFFQPAACQLHWCAFYVTKSHLMFHFICVCQRQMCPWGELKDSLRLISGQCVSYCVTLISFVRPCWSAAVLEMYCTPNFQGEFLILLLEKLVRYFGILLT